MNAQHVEDLLDLEALGALDAEESAFVRAHAADCPHCQAMLDEARETAARLALSVPLQRAPAELRGRVMAEVEAPAAATPIAAFAPARPSSAIMRFNRRWGAMAAMLFLVPLVGLLSWNLLLQNQVNDLQRESQQLQETQRDVVVFAMPSSLRAAFTPTADAGTARGMVNWNPDENRCRVSVRDLAPPAEGASYHVYYDSPAGPREAGELKPDANGSAELSFDVSRWRGDEYRVWVSSVGPHGDSTRLLWASLRRGQP